jgi:hypothetical protein
MEELGKLAGCDEAVTPGLVDVEDAGKAGER